jgi:hypothetical protein
VILGACSGPSSPDVFYAAHGYSCCTEITGTTTWHRGQQLTLHWTPTPPARTANGTPHRIVLSLSLTGPYPTVDALKQATSQGTHPAGVRTISAPQLTANDRTVELPVSMLDLPADLAPGYYNLDAESSAAGLAIAGDAVVVITP